MNSEPLPLVTATAESEEGGAIIALVEVFREALANAGLDCDDPTTLSHGMTAACVFAGTLFGSAIVAGIATDQEKKRCTEAMARNFRTGIDVGKRRGFRILSEMHGGGHA